MYVRFTTLSRDQQSHSLTGVFQAVFALRDTDALFPHEERTLGRALEWLNKHLKVPACLGEPENDRAICWFHDRAQKPIRYVWDLVSILREHGSWVRLHTSCDPGIILYRDKWQVVAKPRRKKQLSKRRRRSSSQPSSPRSIAL